MKVSSFDRQNVKSISAEALAALQDVADKYGLKVKAGAGSFTTSGLTTKFEFCVVDEAGEAMTKERRSFDVFCNRYGLQNTDFGREFTAHGKRLRISGLAISADKYPILAVEIDGTKTYKFTAADARAFLSTAA